MKKLFLASALAAISCSGMQREVPNPLQRPNLVLIDREPSILDRNSQGREEPERERMQIVARGESAYSQMRTDGDRNQRIQFVHTTEEIANILRNRGVEINLSEIQTRQVSEFGDVDTVARRAFNGTERERIVQRMPTPIIAVVPSRVIAQIAQSDSVTGIYLQIEETQGSQITSIKPTVVFVANDADQVRVNNSLRAFEGLGQASSNPAQRTQIGVDTQRLRHTIVHELGHYYQGGFGGRNIIFSENGESIIARIPKWMNEGGNEYRTINQLGRGVCSSVEIRRFGGSTSCTYQIETLNFELLEYIASLRVGENRAYAMVLRATVSGDFREVQRTVNQVIGPGEFERLIRSETPDECFNGLCARAINTQERIDRFRARVGDSITWENPGEIRDRIVRETRDFVEFGHEIVNRYDRAGYPGAIQTYIDAIEGADWMFYGTQELVDARIDLIKRQANEQVRLRAAQTRNEIADRTQERRVEIDTSEIFNLENSQVRQVVQHYRGSVRIGNWLIVKNNEEVIYAFNVTNGSLFGFHLDENRIIAIRRLNSSHGGTLGEIVDRNALIPRDISTIVSNSPNSFEAMFEELAELGVLNRGTVGRI